jgi:multisubunit Na+/H+ antiporter MnhE subunit
MNFAQVHLAINHLPVVLALLSTSILIWALISKSLEIRRVALVLFVAGGITGFAAFLSGDEAADQVKDLPGFTRELIHEHDEAAEFAAIASYITAAIALGILLAPKIKRSLPEKTIYLLLVAGVLTSAAMLRTAHEGGVIKHEEIRGK